MAATCTRPAPRTHDTDADDPTYRLFASRSVAVHLVRGVLGLVALVAGLGLAASSAWWLLLVVGTVVLWRGCPTCWLMGLVATRARAAR